jgi:hypothetical protein
VGADGGLPGVVRRERQGHVAPEPLEQIPHVPHAAVHVLARIEGVPDTELDRPFRHELHQAARTLRGDGHGVPGRLDLDDRLDEPRVHAVALGRHADDLAEGAKPPRERSGVVRRGRPCIGRRRPGPRRLRVLADERVPGIRGHVGVVDDPLLVLELIDRAGPGGARQDPQEENADRNLREASHGSSVSAESTEPRPPCQSEG